MSEGSPDRQHAHAGVRPLSQIMEDLTANGEVIIPLGLVAWRVAFTVEEPYVKAAWFWQHEQVAELHPVDWHPHNEGNVSWRLAKHFVASRLITEILDGSLERAA